MLFPYDSSPRIDPFEATVIQARSALVRAISQCLWQSRPEGKPNAPVIFIVPTEKDDDGQLRCIDPTALPTDQLFADHHLHVYEIATIEGVASLVTQNLALIIETPGVLLILLSLLMTRGVDVVQHEFSAPSGLLSLIGEDACCEQAVVNLIISGRAINEVGEDSWVMGQTLPKVGFLTVEGGFHPATVLKTPIYPVWVAHGMALYHYH